MTDALATSQTRSNQIPGYIRPRPAKILGLSAPAWSVLVSLAGLVLLEVVTRLGLISPVDLIPPTEMAARAAALLADGAFVADQLLPTVGLIALTFVLAGVLGIAVAYLLWSSSWCRRALQPYLNVYYAVPIFAIYPILVVLFGTGRVPIVLVSTAFSVVIIITNTLIGFNAVPETVHKLAWSRRLDQRRYLTKILLPAAAPDIATGLRLGLVYATIAVLATEFIISTHGLGHFISEAYETFRIADMYAGIVLICLLALVLNVTVAAVLNRIDWRRR